MDNVEKARKLIEAEIGPFEVVKLVSSGLNSEISAIVRSDNDTTFIKGRRADHPWIWTQERERAINPAVLHVSPRLKWSAKDDAWDLNGFEMIPGKHVDYSPDSADIPKVVELLRQLQQIRCPDADVKDAVERWKDFTLRPDLLAGSSLLHTDWTLGNVLVDKRAYLVDWAWPTRGAAWIDPACLVVWLIASGHAPRSAEHWAAKVPSWQSAPAGSITEFARIQSLMWAGIRDDSPASWIESVAAASKRWVTYRELQSTMGREY